MGKGRRTWALALTVGAGLALTVTAAWPAAAADRKVAVKIGNFASGADCDGPGGPVLTIMEGDTVTWTNCEGGHTVTFEDGSFDQSLPQPGATATRSFPSAGSFPYYCRIHGGRGGIGMAGTVTVLSSQGSGTTTTRPPATTTTTTTRPPATTSPTTRPPATTTPTAAPTTTPTTATAPTSTTTMAAATTTTTEGSTTTAPATTTTLLAIGESGDDSEGGDPLVVGGLLAALAVVVGGGIWIWRRIGSSLS